MQPAVSPTPRPVTARPRRIADEHRRTGTGPQTTGSPCNAQTATLMRLPPALAPTGRDAVVIGAPHDGATAHRPGTRLAPRTIRHESCPIYGTGGPNILGGIDVVDTADIDLGQPWPCPTNNPPI